MKNCNTCVIVIILVLASCVPTQQFREVSDKSEKLDKERNQLMADNERLTVENTEMKAQRDIVEEERLRFVSDSLKRFEEIQQLRNDLTQLTKRYEDLQSANDALLQGSARETRRLLNELQSTQEDLQKKEARLRELERTVSS